MEHDRAEGGRVFQSVYFKKLGCHTPLSGNALQVQHADRQRVLESLLERYRLGRRRRDRGLLRELRAGPDVGERGHGTC